MTPNPVRDPDGRVNATAEPLATCDQCKLSSPLVELFQPLQRRGKRMMLCPACIAEETRRSGVGALIVLGFAVVMGAAVAALGSGRNHGGWVFLNFALLTVMLWAITVPHEAGHALAARLLGLRVERIVIGAGRLLRTFVVRGVPIDLHALPVGGLTYPEVRDEPAARFKRIVITAAGPLVEVVLLWAALRFWSDVALEERWSQAPAPVTAFIAACIFGLIANLLPLRAQTPAGAMGNDGAQLLWLIFSRRIPFAEMAWAMTIQRAQLMIVHGQDVEAERFSRAALGKYANDPYLTVALSAAVLNQHRHREGRALLEALLRRQDLPRKVAAVASNNLAWANVHLPDPALIEEARTLSAAAYCMLPWEPYVASTYGCIEALHGELEAARTALERALSSGRRLQKRAPALAGTAVVHARARRWSESASALMRAEAAEPQCPFLRIVRERIEKERAAAGAPV